ncbi:Tripeptidyl-peptidase SED2 [Tolypocladium ophioglossoides CBS 100239]|uniref:tripeptidyl-peptidase II n=1 Tax=Tolypocladium ophioglossoides (strain CBS 100239) TaxID=1163406 RepID=A0A0L0N2T2_TOLOC|nr:Tripeptidyl-peptidase SED2 [Tolypocladium ophioglossoides CBS 100239]
MASKRTPRGFYALVTTLEALAAALPVLADILEQRPAPRSEVRAANRQRFIDLSISLEPESHELLERTLYEISDPSSRRYGKHLTREEAKSLLLPRQESAESVKRWLFEAGVPDDHVRDGGTLIHARLAVEHAEQLLSTRFVDGHQSVTRLAESVPTDLRGHITTIHPRLVLGDSGLGESLQSKIQTQTSDPPPDEGIAAEQDGHVDLQQCKTRITPACLRELYHMGDTYAKPHKKSLLGVAGFDGQAAQHDMLDKFLSMFARYAIGANFSTELINGGKNPQGEYYSAEANLDVQYTIAMAYKVPVRYYSTGGEDHDFIPDLDISDPKKEYIEPWLPFVSHLLELPDDQLPQVVSISYGVNEQAVPKAHAKQVCNMFGLLGTRGVSVIVSSGDTGPGVSCQSNDGTNTTKFLPSFPATCPYVTSVGATESNGPESATNFSSGGFSDYWPRPAWQEEVIGKYLTKHGKQWQGYYSPKGRGVPDVAAQGKAFLTINHGLVAPADGTSASAPVFASIVALLNDLRFQKGKPPMGFLNPWLYNIGHNGFTDITVGRSDGCLGTSYSGAPAPKIPGAGWDAVPGWDPVTGWGTPLFDSLKILACN